MSFGFGLLGEKLSHSYSPMIHNALGAYDYGLYEVTPEALEDFMKNGTFSGLNVTSPYKKEVCKYVELDPIAIKLGNVNTVYHKDGILRGTNTDYFGFLYLLSLSGINPEDKKVLILGSGGASDTVKSIIEACKPKDVFVASRKKSKEYVSYNNLPKDAQIIINTTPVGTYPNSYDTIIDLKDFEKCEAVIDLVYNPFKTPLLLQAEKLGMKISNGIPMLVAQALRSAEFFTGMSFRRYTADIIPELETYVKNIVIIGMPGSGKTTIGKAVAAATGRTFISTDEEIVKRAGRSIPEIFASDGEEAFRSMEQAVLKDICKESGLVIATGGGSVLRDENKDIIRCNSIAVEILRDYSLLSTEGRPLSEGKSAEDLEVIYAERKCHYDAVKDISVENNLAPEEVAKLIIDKIRRNSK